MNPHKSSFPDPLDGIDFDLDAAPDYSMSLFLLKSRDRAVGKPIVYVDGVPRLAEELEKERAAAEGRKEVRRKHPFKYDAHVVTYGSLEELVAQLSTAHPKEFAINERIADGVSWDRLQKLQRNFEPVKRRLVIIDSDQMGRTDWDGDAVARELRSRLPAEFANVRCAWNLTASHAINAKGVSKIRAFFLTDRAVDSDDVAGWLGAFMPNPVDPAIYNFGQAIYLGPGPITGGPDPFAGKRWGVLEGDEAVVKVPLDIKPREKTTSNFKWIAPANVTTNNPHTLYLAIQGVLQKRTSDNTVAGGRHNTIRHVAYRLKDRAVSHTLTMLICRVLVDHEDDGALDDLRQVLTECGYIDPQWLCERIRLHAVRLDGAFSDIDASDVEKQVDDAYRSKQKQFGCVTESLMIAWSDGDDGEDFAAVAEEDAGEPPSKIPQIHYDPTRKADVARSVERALAAACPDFFEWGGQLQRVVVEVESRNGVTRKIAKFVPVKQPYLMARIDQVMVLFKKEKNDDGKLEKIKVACPKALADLILERSGDWAFKRVRGLINTPTLRPDGSLLIAPGYDEATGLYLVDGLAMPPLDLTPSKEAAQRALGLLKGLFDETACVDDASRAVLVSGVLTTIARGAFDVAPAHATDAPSAGSGKTFPLEVIEATATGFRPAPMATGSTVEEMEKRLTGAQLEGRPIICLDNISAEVKGDALAMAISSPRVSLRTLGRTGQTEVPNNSTILMSGNNLRIVADMTRRVLVGRIDTKSERPELIERRRDPINEVLSDRGRFVGAALTVLLGFLAARKAGSAETVKPRLAGFGGWSDLVRSALVWLGEADPVATLDRARDSDPDAETRRAIFEAIHEAFGDKPFTVHALMNHGGAISETSDFAPADDGGEPAGDVTAAGLALGEVLVENLGRFVGDNARKVAHWLRSNKDKVTAGLTLVLDGYDGNRKAPLWRVKRAGEA